MTLTETVTLADASVPAPPPSAADWNDDGVVVLPGFLPDDLLDAYEDEWRAVHGYGWPAARPGGWSDCTPYMRHDALRRLLCDHRLAAVLDADVVTHLPNRGDVLVWHGRLLHRGSRAVVPGAYRPALIAHYSGIRHREDMPLALRHEAGGWFFPINGGPA